MRYFRYSLLIFLVSVLYMAKAQSSFPADYFRPPLDVPLYLSGTFGELRPNHFHAGIDIKTQGVEGLKVYAVADGYVSRIKVSLSGYGNALYITHPNGYVSVYGHLKRFNNKINKYLREYQYQRKSFTINLFPDKNLLKVKKGDIIAVSGNSGGSLGPHLHFEIRMADNQHPVNPLLFKSIKISDHRKPVISSLIIYPVGDSSVVNDGCDTSYFKINGKNGDYHLPADTIIRVYGNIAFGLRSYDLMDKIRNKNGIYQEQLWLDSTLVFDIQMKELSFYTSLYINSLIDYNFYQKKHLRVIRTQLDTNNKLAIYRTIENNGIFEFSDTLVHNLKYVVKDIYGNTSYLPFKLQGYHPDTVIRKKRVFPKDDSVYYVHYSRKTKLTLNGMSADFPANAFYRSQPIPFAKHNGNDETYSDFYTIGSRFIPLQKYCALSIRVNRKVSDSLKTKMFMAMIEDDGQKDFAGGNYKDEYINTKIRSLGTYAIYIDTIPPVIKPLNIRSDKKISSQKSLKFKIYDEFTGVKKYVGLLNNKWILMEYDPKKATLTYNFDWLLKKGKNSFKLYVFDNRDNRSVYKAVLYY